jgi:iron complex outermembrane receptor protein
MGIRRSTLIGTAVAMALFGREGAAQAQSSNQSASDDVQEVVVTGIRKSVQESIDAKRVADSHIEVISAEDIGKMPDKNVADSLVRVPGVTTSSASANEGGFDENDRVSMRGTNPSLTQTLINGHNVGSGDWFVLNQTGTVGRSVSYTLLPSELINQVVVHKSSEASLVEGGVAGSIDIITRRPLDFKDSFTMQASAGVVYAEQPDKTDGQYSALANWKNDADTFGVMVQGFWETRHLRRDGIEVLGYNTISAANPAMGISDDLVGVKFPDITGAALFTQKRERKGGLIDVQLKPTDSFMIDAQFFTSDLDATNVNRNFLFFTRNLIGTAPLLPGYVVKSNTLTSASFGPGGPASAVYDQISRPNEKATSNFGSVEGRYQFSDSLTLSGQIGTSVGHGKTPRQDVAETVSGAGLASSYQLNGMGTGPSFSFDNVDNTTPASAGFGWLFGVQDVDVKDKEDWAKLDAAFAMDGGAWTGIQVGARFNKHKRESNSAIGQGPLVFDTSAYPTTFDNYPSDFHSFGGDIPQNIWLWSADQLKAYNDAAANRDPVIRKSFSELYQVEEKNSAAFVQANFKGSNWSGNIGARYVQTKENVLNYASADATDPDAILGSAFGTFKPVHHDHTYNDFLPSANLKIDMTQDLVARFAVSKTMTRADYSALGGAVSLGAPPPPGGVGSGSGGNPDLKPIRSTNFDAGLEWYFAPKSLVSATLFYMDLNNYVSFGTDRQSYVVFDALRPDGAAELYDLAVPINAKGRVRGVELAWQQAFGEYFGANANYTYADGKQTNNVLNDDDRLVGTSKNTYNLGGYFENQRFSARVGYTNRSAFFSGLDRNSAFSQDKIGNLAASLVYTVNDSLSFNLDGQNLNNPTLKYFSSNRDQPRAFYKNGAQYYFTVRYKF